MCEEGEAGLGPARAYEADGTRAKEGANGGTMGSPVLAGAQADEPDELAEESA